MSTLEFAVLDSRVERYAAAPMLSLRVGVAERTGTRIHAIALRTQVQIEPRQRPYSDVEAERLLDLFGPPARYGETLRPMLWTHVAQVVVGFTGETEVALSIPCSYDFEVAAHTYLGALEDGKIPLNLLFSGTVFVEGESGVTSEFVPWTCEARYQLPVATWRDAMEAFFPNGRWIRLDREAFDELQRFKSAGAFPTWDRAIAALCASARVAT